MLTAILFYLVVLFLLEVILGSDIGVYNPEIGYEAHVERVTRLSAKRFFGHLLPLAMLSTGGLYALVHSGVFF